MRSSRRDFLKKMSAAGLLVPFSQWPLSAFGSDQITEPLKVHLFSKHLQFLDYSSAGQVAAELGFNGLDLTVRPKGHVLPENVSRDLPIAIEKIKKAGSSCKLITTSISDVANTYDTEIIKNAAKNGVEYYRTHWFKYLEDRPMEESLEWYKEKIRELGELNKEHTIIGCYQNHAGTNVGASFWEIKEILASVDPMYFGTQYDIRHAMAEGGHSWVNGLQLLKDHIKVIVLKDFKWGKVDGQWKAINVPIGDGMVDFTSYFKLLKSYGLNPPVSLHLEYDLGGAEKGHDIIKVDKKVVFDAMKKDLMAVQQLWKNA